MNPLSACSGTCRPLSSPTVPCSSPACARSPQRFYTGSPTVPSRSRVRYFKIPCSPVPWPYPADPCGVPAFPSSSTRAVQISSKRAGTLQIPAIACYPQSKGYRFADQDRPGHAAQRVRARHAGADKRGMCMPPQRVRARHAGADERGMCMLHKG